MAYQPLQQKRQIGTDGFWLGISKMPYQRPVLGMTEIAYMPDKKNNVVVAKDISDIALDRQYGTRKSTQATKAKIAASNMPRELKKSAAEYVDFADTQGNYYLDLLSSRKGEILLEYLAKEGGYSEGIDKIIIMDQDSPMIAATAPKQRPGFILVNKKTAEQYIKMLRKDKGHVSDPVAYQDFLGHELTHSFAHDQYTDKLQAEIEVEKALIFTNYKVAGETKSKALKNQYLVLADDHVRRYFQQKAQQAAQKGQYFDFEAEMKQLFSEYQQKMHAKGDVEAYMELMDEMDAMRAESLEDMLMAA